MLKSRRLCSSKIRKNKLLNTVNFFSQLNGNTLFPKRFEQLTAEDDVYKTAELEK